MCQLVHLVKGYSHLYLRNVVYVNTCANCLRRNEKMSLVLSSYLSYAHSLETKCHTFMSAKQNISLHS